MSYFGISQDFDVTDSLIQHAINVIFETYGDVVSVDAKNKDLIKFGTNPSVGTSRATIWYSGQDNANETYVADNTNSIDSISSGSTTDNVEILIEGHTMSGGDRTFVRQTKTLNGRTRVALDTPLNRITRIENNSGTNLVGEIYGYENTALASGKPSNTTKNHITVPAGEQKSQKASTSLSSTDYWIVTGFNGGSLTKTGSNVNEMRLETRLVGGVFKPQEQSIPFPTSGANEFNFKPYLIIPKNADVRLTGLSSAGGQILTGGIQGFLAQIVV